MTSALRRDCVAILLASHETCLDLLTQEMLVPGIVPSGIQVNHACCHFRLTQVDVESYWVPRSDTQKYYCERKKQLIHDQSFCS